MVRGPEAHRTAVSNTAAYYVAGAGAERDGGSFVGESSRRARAFPIYAALRELGRDGLTALIERCCLLAARMADGLRDAPGTAILNDVVLNQVLVRFAPPGVTDPAAHDA